MSPEAIEPSVPEHVPGFSVALDQFEGPFDLLLSLIARQRLDVTELALAEVTDDFLAYMRKDVDLGHASEFLVVAATLLALKAYRLLPHEEGEEEPEDLELFEARDLLFARLLQYRAYKEAAAVLAERAENASRSHRRSVCLPLELSALLPPLVSSISPEELAQRAASALARPEEPGVQTVHLHEPVPVGAQIRMVLEHLREQGVLRFSELISDAERTAVVVARFLALLILHREGRIDLEQDAPMEDITIAWREGAEDALENLATDSEEEFA